MEGNVTIGEKSCNGGRFSCEYSGSEGIAIIGDGSCNAHDTCWGIGYIEKDVIGDNSCNGAKACSFLEESIEITIGNNACNGKYACYGSGGSIADGCCNYKNACQYNSDDIKVGSEECDGIAVTTKST